jgi:hypothetical protein
MVKILTYEMFKTWTTSYSEYFLWLSHTLSLKKLKLSTDFFCLACRDYVASSITTFHDLTLKCADAFAVQLTLSRLLSLLVEPRV